MGSSPLVTLVNNIVNSIFPNIQVYINQQIYISNGLYAHNYYLSNNFKWAHSQNKGVLHIEGYNYEEFFDEIMEALLSEPFFRRRTKILRRADCFMLFGKLGVDFFCTSEVMCPIMKLRLQLISARPNFYMISDNTNVSLEIVECSLQTRRIALMDDSTTNEWLCSLIFLWNSTLCRLYHRFSPLLSGKTSSFNKTC